MKSLILILVVLSSSLVHAQSADYGGSSNATQIQGRVINPVAPTSEQVLTWNSTTAVWEPQAGGGGGGAGTVTDVGTGTGLLGGPITTSGTLSVDVGTAANKILQLNTSGLLPVVDGSLLTNLNASRIGTRTISTNAPSSGQIIAWNATTSQWNPITGVSGTVTNVAGGTGIIGGPVTSVGTLSVDVGTAANKILQVTSATQYPALDGFLITNINAINANATELQGFAISTTAPTSNQIFTWNATTSAWNATTLTGTTNQVNVGASGGLIVLSTPQNIATTSKPTFGSLTITGQIAAENGTLAAPAYSFSSELGSGTFWNSAGDIIYSVKGDQAAEALYINSSQVNWGFGPSGTVSAGVGVPFTFSNTLNGTGTTVFVNASTGTSSVTTLEIANGTSSNYATVENWANYTGSSASSGAGYLNGGSALMSSPNQTQLAIGSENTSATTFIGFTLGGRSLAKEQFRMNPTNFTLNHGNSLIMNGSSSGAITITSQAGAGSYNFNLPTTSGSAGQVLASGGGGSAAMTWSSGLTSLKAPTIQQFTTTGSTVGYIFTVSATASSVAAGCVYTNNGNSYTVATAVLTGATTIFFTQASAPAGSGTLTYSSGGGSACNGGSGTNLTFSAAQAYATYTAPTNPSPLYIRAIVSGGGGGGGASTSPSGGSAGGTSYFGASLITCTGGGLGSNQGSLGTAAGGTATATGLTGIVVSGGGGASADSLANSTGESGGSNPLGGAGAAGNGSVVALNGAANTGAGGGGAGANGASNGPGGGGGSGGYVNVIITSPGATYPYAVGTGGTGQSGTRSGGNGGSGVVTIEEYYQ